MMTPLRRKEIPNDEGRTGPLISISIRDHEKGCLHGIWIATNSKRKAAWDSFRWIVVIRTLQRTASEHRLLRAIESDGSEFLPIADELILCDDLMQSKFSLYDHNVSELLVKKSYDEAWTNISQTLNRHIDQLRHLFVPAKDLAGPSPATSRNCHTSKDSIVLHQTTLKPHFRQNELDIGQTLHSFTEFGAEFIELS